MEKKNSELSGKTCDRCGRPAAIKVGDEFFCEECYQLPGSCCPEFGGEDIWEVKEPPREPGRNRRAGDQGAGR